MKKLALLLCFQSMVVFSQNQLRPTGLIIDEYSDEVYQATPLKSPDMGFQDVVADVTSASLKPFAPEVKNQSEYGTCVGWATAYYGRTIIEAKQKGLSDKAEISKLAFSPLFTYLNSNVASDVNCIKGAYLSKALEHMSTKGTVFYNEFPDLCAEAVPENLYDSAQSFKIKDFTKLFDKEDDTALKVEQVKRSLISDNPVIIGFKVDSDFVAAKEVYLPSAGVGASGHAMCIVGFDDDKYGGAFEVINSWGTQWGNDGYTWVRYEDFAARTSYAYEIIPFPKKINSKNQLSGAVELITKTQGRMDVHLADSNDPNTLQFQTVVVDEETLGIGDYMTNEKYGSIRYHMNVKVNKPSYLYIFGYQVGKGTNVLCPNPRGDNLSTYFNFERGQIRLPQKINGKNYSYQLNDDGVDSDYTIVLFSLEELAIVDIVKNIGKSDDGSLLDKVYTELGDKLIDNNDMVLSQDTVGFDAEFEKGSVAMLILDIRRTNP